jgi:hypothetical protein
MDQIAGVLNRTATAKDLIVVDPWNHGITFGRYYHGPARWVTLPQIEDHRTHRYDLVLRARLEQARGAPDPVLAEAARTLREGGRVYLVGVPSIPETDPRDGPPPPITDDPRTWRQVHADYWSRQLGYLLKTEAEEFRPIPVRKRRVNRLEFNSLYEAQGLRSARPMTVPATGASRPAGGVAEEAT